MKVLCKPYFIKGTLQVLFSYRRIWKPCFIKGTLQVLFYKVAGQSGRNWLTTWWIQLASQFRMSSSHWPLVRRVLTCGKWKKKLGTEVGSFMYWSLSRCCGTEESTSFFSRSPSDFCPVHWHLYEWLHSWYWRWSIVVCFSIWSPDKGRSLRSRWWTTPPSPVLWWRSSSLNMWVDTCKLHTNMLVFVVIFIFTMYSVLSDVLQETASLFNCVYIAFTCIVYRHCFKIWCF